MSSIISTHNKKILNEKKTKEKANEKECNCKKGENSCPTGTLLHSS